MSSSKLVELFTRVILNAKERGKKIHTFDQAIRELFYQVPEVADTPQHRTAFGIAYKNTLGKMTKARKQRRAA